MKLDLMDNLFNALDALEESILSTRTILNNNKKLNKNSYQVRLNSYEEALSKQKKLANELDIYIKTTAPSSNTSAEIKRRVDLINGLSIMIRDDARELTLELLYNRKTNKDEIS